MIKIDGETLVMSGDVSAKLSELSLAISEIAEDESKEFDTSYEEALGDVMDCLRIACRVEHMLKDFSYEEITRELVTSTAESIEKESRS